MAQIISINRAADSILRTGRLTLAKAKAKGGAIHTTAETYLLDYVQQAKAIARQVTDHAELVDEARMERDAYAEHGSDVAGEVRDDLYNRIGRRLRDPLFRRSVSRGLAAVIGATPKRRADALRRMAADLETLKHPRIPHSVAAPCAEDLREADADLTEANERLVRLVAEGKELAAKFAAYADGVQLQLRRLKKAWAGDGMTDQEIHEIIPDGRPRPKKGRPDPAKPADGANVAETAASDGEDDPEVEAHDVQADEDEDPEVEDPEVEDDPAEATPSLDDA